MPSKRAFHVLLKPGVMDPVAQSTLAAAADLGVPLEAVSTLRKYWFAGIDDSGSPADRRAAAGERRDRAGRRRPAAVRAARSRAGRISSTVQRVPIRQLDDDGLVRLSREGQLYLQLAEMQTIRGHFRELGREPTDVELETIAQTWSEHCSHKTLAGRIAYRDENGERQFENMLKETIFAATQRASPAAGRRRLVRQRVRGQRRRRAVRRRVQRLLQGRDAQPSVGASSPTAAPTPGSAA